MTVSVHAHLSSATIHIPEASPLIGKDVRIIVVEEPAPRPARDLNALDRIAGAIDLDVEAIDELRQRSVL